MISSIPQTLIPRILAGLLLLLLPARGLAQDDAEKSRREIERMVGDGMVEALDARFKGERSLDQLRWLALAQANKAAQVRDSLLRYKEFEDADKRFQRWLGVAEARSADSEAGAAALASAKLEYASMILSRWAAPELDEFEMTAGRRGDAARLTGLLQKARDQYEQSRKLVEPLLKLAESGKSDVEDKLLLTGLLDTIKRVDLDSKFSLAWTNLYLAIVDSKNAEARSAALKAAERGFQDVINTGVPLADTAARCYLGLAITLREQDRFEPADKQFGLALQQQPSGPLDIQIRFERGKSQLLGGRFDDGRAALHPLLEKDLEHLAPEDRPARFYLNLAALWDAYGYLLEAGVIEKSAADSAARETLLRRAERTRDTGIAAMNRLAVRGGPWPGLVQLYVASTLKSSDPKKLSAAELLFSARQLAEEKKYREALERLTEAGARKGTTPEIAADVAFELASIHYRNQQPREAAAAFERYCREFKDTPRAPSAATYAYELWAAAAEKSREREDYQRLADLLMYVLKTFPEHEKRADCMWWLPVALEGAQRYGEAADQFANVPQRSPHWEEAQFRRLQCLRHVLDAERSNLPAGDYAKKAGKLADELAAYSADALHRAEGGKEKDPKKWSAHSLVAAAELLVSPELNQPARALTQVDSFEERFSDSELLGRVLAVRVRALRALKREAEAAKVVEDYLKKAPASSDGGILAIIAQGMQEEIDRLEQAGQDDAMRQIARDAIPTFEQLQTWARAEQSRAKHLKSITFGLARVYYLSGESEKAKPLAASLLFQEPQNGNFVRLNALILEAALGDKPSAEQFKVAEEAWGNLLRDPELRTKLPGRYWEARYHLLSILMRSGRADEVRKAIEQDRVWQPDLGGPPWSARLQRLAQQAATSAPTSRP